MKWISIALLILVTQISSCDMRSDTAKREMEDFSGTPTPTILPVPTEAPVDPADVVSIDATRESVATSVNGYKQTIPAVCKAFERLRINGNENIITVKGPCRQIMLNGDRNKVTADAATEFVLNGTNNAITYSRYVNGKRPIINDNADGNTVEKISTNAVTSNQPKRTIIK